MQDSLWLHEASLPPSLSVLAMPLPWHLAEHAAAAAAKSLESCPTLCDPRDGSPPGSPIPGILQARTLEWVAISFFNASKWKVKVKSISRVQPLVTPWATAYQAPPSMGFSRQKYSSGVPLPSLSFPLIKCNSISHTLFPENTHPIFLLYTEILP